MKESNPVSGYRLYLDLPDDPHDTYQKYVARHAACDLYEDELVKKYDITMTDKYVMELSDELVTLIALQLPSNYYLKAMC